MLTRPTFNQNQETKLYNKILFLSRNKLLYTKLNLMDTFQNRINLIFIHFSFLLIKMKLENKNTRYKDFSQKMFDFVFRRIELDMRESGFGDVTINKNMKFLVKIFYNILLNCENYVKKSINYKNLFLNKYLTRNINKKTPFNNNLVEYFDQYQAFCLDLSSDNVLKGELNFNYK